MEKVTIQTKDGVKIAGNWWFEKECRKAALLLHMRPATKESWDDLASELLKRNVAALAIDLRGHGESIWKDTTLINYQDFSEAEERESYKDIEAAVEFLAGKGFAKNQIVLAGASIGANLALWYAADNSEIAKVALLSPGFNYRGIETKPLAARLSRDQQLLIAFSSRDPRSDADPAEIAAALSKEFLGTSELKTQDSDLHGTDLFKGDPELLEGLVNWLAE